MSKILGFMRFYSNVRNGVVVVMKPDPAIDQAVQTTLDAEPASILFFDDGHRNVEAARALGWQAEQVFGPDDIRQQLDQYQLN